MKYLFLTFSDDGALSLDTSLLNTEVHVLPAGDPRWSCGPEHPGGDGKASEPSVECVQTAQEDELSEPPGNDVPFKVADEKHLRVCVVLTSTGVCNGAILFCQPNLKHCNHVCQSSVVFLWALLER